MPDGYEVLHRGTICDVLIKSSVKRELEKKATDEQLAGLVDLVRRYGEGGWQCIPKKKFNNNEGWFPSKKDKRVRLEAIKPWQLRAYGFCQEFNGRRTFIITGVDTSKKQNGADQTILQTAGAEAVRITSLL